MSIHSNIKQFYSQNPVPNPINLTLTEKQAVNGQKIDDLFGDQNFKFSSDGAAANSVWAQESGSNVLVRGDANGETIHDFGIYVASVDDLYVYDFIL